MRPWSDGVFRPAEAGTGRAPILPVARPTDRPDRREFARVRLLMPLHGKIVGVHSPMILRDISLGGFSVMSPIPFPSSVEHAIEFTLMGREVILTARVAHCARTNTAGSPVYLVGFSFVRTQASDGDTIDALVRAATTPAEALR